VPGGNSSPYIKRLWPSRYPLQSGRTRSGNWSFLRSRKGEKQFVSAGVWIAEKRQSARVGQICIADQVANLSHLAMKLQWTPKKSTEAQFAVDVPDVFTQAFVMEKGSKRFPRTGGWGIRGVQLRCRIGQVHGRSQEPLRLRKRVHTAVKAKDYIFHPVRSDNVDIACGRPKIQGRSESRGSMQVTTAILGAGCFPSVGS
jgi:hypothetical protein